MEKRHMLQGRIDLHLHTICSDGQETPEELVETALKADYTVISITDHDTVAGIPRALVAARNTGLEVIPGIELSAIDGSDDVHILGYFVDYENPDFLEQIQFFKDKRHERAEEIVRNLNKVGLDIQIDTVLRIAHGAPIGRPHIAEALVAEELVDTYSEAFFRYIGADGPAYVPKYEVKPAEAIQLILQYGGVPVIAHPGVFDRDEMIFELKADGLMGIEAIHPFHTTEKQKFYIDLGRKLDLIVTGGSDWHGQGRSSNFKKLINLLTVPQTSVDRMKKIIAHRNERGTKLTGIS
ncbi:PHP domain-containing protein [Candidatus Latescibacterota bacterium]